MQDLDSKLNYEIEYTKYLDKPIKSGKEITSLCPFHKERNRSFAVNLETGKYKCFSCGKEGNFVNFISELKDIPTKDAYKEILKDNGLYQEIENNENIPFIEQYANSKRLPLEFLKKQFDLKPYRKGMQIPYFDENNKEIAMRYRYKDKQFRWKKGSKIHFYGLQGLEKIKKANYVVLVEGESDLQTLWYHNISAIGVPGATTFSAERFKLFKDIKKIYIHQESDNGGKVFRDRVINELDKIGKHDDVFVIKMPFKDVKDPSDLHIKFKDTFDLKWKEIINKAVLIDVNIEANKVSEIVEGSELYLKCPIGYKIDKTGIYRLDKKTNEYIRFSGNPILINRNLIDIESTTMMTEIKYNIMGKWRKVTLPRTTLLNDYSVISLVDLGIQIQKSNGKYLTDFLSNLELENNIKTDKSSERLGWQGEYFLPTDRDKLHMYAEGAMKQWLNAFEEKGELNNWIERIRPYRENLIFRFILASSFAAPLLKIVNSRSVIIHLWATSRAGKTAALKAAMSVWGDPNRITTTFNATKVGLERLSAFFCDMPLGMDEKQVVGGNQDFINNLIYMLGGSTSKMRGNKIGGVDEVKNWRNIVITTGEEPITSEKSNTGISSRLIEINGVPFEDENKAREMYDIILDNYGTAGNFYINEIKKVPNREIKNKVKEYKTELIEKASDKSGSNLEILALVKYADIFISKTLFNEPEDVGIIKAEEMITEILEGIESKDEIDITKKAYEFLVSWCGQNDPMFNGENRFTQYGVVLQSDEDENITEYCIFPNVFDQVLIDNGYYPKKIKTELAERGLIASYRETFNNYTRNRFSVIRKIRDKRMRMIVLNISKIDIEKINEFSFEAEE